MTQQALIAPGLNHSIYTRVGLGDLPGPTQFQLCQDPRMTKHA